jgi:predicted RNase H-like nuclease
MAELEAARDYHAQQAANWKHVAEERGAWIAELERGYIRVPRSRAVWRRLMQRKRVRST